MNNKSTALVAVPVMLSFFVMGFVDLVGIASNYVKEDLALTDVQANICPSLVFFWFLIFSVPTGMLMNRIGRKNTVLLSLVVTALSLAIPLFGESFPIMLLSFALLGIGNALMQTSINPLVSTIITGPHLASTLTFGQFVKAIASFMAPYIAMWGATGGIPSLGLGWKVLFPIYMVISIVATLLLWSTPIEEQPATGKTSSVVDCLRLLANPTVLMAFVAIMCCVGIDVGTNTTAPKILMERLGLSLNDAAFATSLYFICRTVGCLSGSFLMRVMRHSTFYAVSIVLILLSACGLVWGTTQTMLYVAVGLMGLGNSNVFSIIMSKALLSMPDKQNEVSGLMIMGLFGGTVFPVVMGYASDAVGQAGAVGVMALCGVYLLACCRKM